MRAPNEKYVVRKDKMHFADIYWPEDYKDLFGFDIKIGGYVIWQPYSSGDGMHIGQVYDFGKDGWIKIKTADNKTISRHGHELVLLLQNRMRFEDCIEE